MDVLGLRVLLSRVSSFGSAGLTLLSRIEL